MYEYTIIKDNNILKLTGQQHKWQVRSVTGLNPPKTNVFESTLMGVPGVKKTGSKIDKRNIVFTIHINHPCEANRDELLQFLSTDYEIDIQIKTAHKNLTIKGTVETNEYDIYTQSQTMQVSVLCDYPYFKSSDDRVVSYADYVGGFQFPLDLDIEEKTMFDKIDLINNYVLYNYGQIATGLKIELSVFANTSDIIITNVDNTSQFFGLKGEYLAGDKIYIDTNPTATDKVMLIRDGVKTKILKKLMPGTTWFNIKNVLVLTVSPNVYMTITNHDEVAGV